MSETPTSPFGQEFRAFFFAPFLDVAAEVLPAEQLAGILSELGVTEAQLRDPSTWVTFDFCVRACAALDEAIADPSLFYRCGRLAFSQKYMGMLRPIIRSFGSPAFAFSAMVKQLPRFNKVGQVKLLSLTVEGQRGHLVQTYGPVPGGPHETTRHICTARMGQIAAMPTLFDLPPAKVTHPQCMADGFDECRYEVTWQEPRKTRGTLIAAIAGAASGVLGATWLAAPAALTGALGLTLGLAAAGWYRSWTLARRLAERVEDVSLHQDALLQTARENEARFQELLSAKTAVDEEVTQRTAELAQTSHKLQDALQEAQAVAQARDRFFANVSHDLKTPMQLLIGPIDDLIAGREPPGGQAQTLQVMRRNAHRQLHLVEQLLMIAQVDAGAPRFEPVPTQITQVLHQVVQAYHTVAEGQRVRLIVEAEPMEPVAVDPFWLESALNNLISNALRFVEPGGEVRMSSRLSGGHLQIQVSDDGPGIPEQMLPRVFERFAQAGDQRAHRGGVGLGLAIVKEAANLHDGDVDVVSTPKDGTRFTLTLPYRPSLEPPAAAPALTTTPSPGPPVALDVPADMQPRGPAESSATILVVEDHPDVREFVTQVIARRYSVQTAPDGQQGIQTALRIRPDVIVSDVSMPHVDGYELCAAVRADARIRTTPIILLTAHSGSAALLKGLDAGADDYVTKPFSADELLARIDVQLRLRRLMVEIAHSNRLASLGVLSTALAHQIRNPLVAITNGTNLLAPTGRVEGEARDELVAIVQDSARRIEQLTSDLLTFARDRPSAQTIPLQPVVERTLRLVQMQSGRDEIPLTVAPAAHGLSMALREVHLGHILLVLLDNALRAAGPEGLVGVNLDLLEGLVHIEVYDDGPGIPTEHQEQVFDPFFSTRPAGEGTGLGLALARQLTHESGGHLNATARRPNGTAMVLQLPLDGGAPPAIAHSG